MNLIATIIHFIINLIIRNSWFWFFLLFQRWYFLLFLNFLNNLVDLVFVFCGICHEFDRFFYTYLNWICLVIKEVFSFIFLIVSYVISRINSVRFEMRRRQGWFYLLISILRLFRCHWVPIWRLFKVVAQTCFALLMRAMFLWSFASISSVTI